MIPWYSLLPAWLWNIIELFLLNYFLAMLATTVSFLSFEYVFPFLLVVAIGSLSNDYLQERRLTFGRPAIHTGIAGVLLYLTGKFIDMLYMEEIKPENGSHRRTYKFTSINQQLSFYAAICSVFVLFLIRIDYYLVLSIRNTFTKSDESVRGLETSPSNRYRHKNNNFLNGERKRIYCE